MRTSRLGRTIETVPNESASGSAPASEPGRPRKARAASVRGGRVLEPLTPAVDATKYRSFSANTRSIKPAGRSPVCKELSACRASTKACAPPSALEIPFCARRNRVRREVPLQARQRGSVESRPGRLPEATAHPAKHGSGPLGQRVVVRLKLRACLRPRVRITRP